MYYPDESVERLLKELAPQLGGKLYVCKSCHIPFIVGGSTHQDTEYCIEHSKAGSKSFSNHYYKEKNRGYAQAKKTA